MWIPKVTWNRFLACGLAVFGSCLDGVWVFLHLQCPDGVCIGWACALWLQRLFMWIPNVTWNSFLACGLGGFRLVSRWCLGLFASAVSRWCLHRLGMCSVAPKLFYVVPDGVCIGWACDVAPKIVFLACGLGGFRLVSRCCLGLFASAVSRWCLHRLGMCSVAPKIVLCGFQR